MNVRVIIYAFILTLTHTFIQPNTDLGTDQKKSPFDLLQTDYQKPYSILQENEWNELSIDTFLTAIGKPITSYGSWGLYNSLHLSADQTSILRTQSLIRALAEDEALYNRVTELLNTIAEHEKALQSYYDPGCQLHIDAQKLYYRLFDWPNTQPLILDASFLVDVGICVGAVAGIIGLTGLYQKLFSPDTSIGHLAEELISAARQSPEALISNQQLISKLTPTDKAFDIWQSMYDIFSEFPRSHWPWLIKFQSSDAVESMKKTPSNYLMSMGCSLADKALIFEQGYGIPKQLASLVATLIVVGQDGHLGLSVFGTVTALKASWALPSQLRTELLHVAELFKAYDELITILNAVHTDFGSLIDTPDSVLDSELSTCTAYVKNLLNNNGSIFYSRGSVLYAHRLLSNTKEDCISLLRTIGSIDAFTILAKLIRESRTDQPWTYVTFVDSPLPYMHAHNFWSPLLTNVANNLVLNSLTMNADNQKIILTGPNGGGKSVVMKSLLYQIICAQSWGIAPTERLEMAPFDGIYTALNPQEDIRKRLSTFMAQKLRMDTVQSVIRGSQNKRIFVAIDEPYRGTVEHEAQKRVLEFASAVAGESGVSLIMATHFEKPTELETMHNSAYRNYQCDFSLDPHGILRPNYRFIPGKADWWFHDVKKRSQYIDYLLEQPDHTA